MEIGYYFYKDGKFGSDYKDGNTIGIIYKIGKHATDDIANYAGSKLEDNIRGYVVALKDEVNDEDDTFQWRTGTDSEGLSGDDYPENGVGDGKTTKYLGYPNTKYLIAKAKEKRIEVPAASASTSKDAPENTSGWYLPSHTQLKDLAVLANASYPNYIPLKDTYWDSSFDGGNTNAYVVNFNANGAIGSTIFWEPVGHEHKVRLILTF